MIAYYFLKIRFCKSELITEWLVIVGLQVKYVGVR